MQTKQFRPRYPSYKRRRPSSGTQPYYTAARQPAARPTMNRFTSSRPTACSYSTAMTRPAPEIKSWDVIPGQVTSLELVNFAHNSVAGAYALPQPIAFTGMLPLNVILQGATFYNRIGAKVTIKSIQMKANFILAVAATNTVCRYMIVYDKQTNGAFPALGDILETNDTLGLTFDAGLNMTNRSRFSMLRDKTFPLDAGSGIAAHCSEYIKGRWETEFSTTTGTIGDIRSGAIYFIAFTNGLGGHDAAYLYDATFRLRYYD